MSVSAIGDKRHPRSAVARCSETRSAPTAEEKPLPASVADTPQDSKSPAEWAYQRIILYIQNFEEQLDNEHEVAMGFTGSDAGVLKIEGIGYFDPDIVTFYGTDGTGTKTQLVQHVSQLNVILRALPRDTGKDEPYRIGFRLAADLERDAAATPDEE
ncbi:DUF6173 family protein [Maritimibacter sp. UBA3975]|uniref:DUF6173 family protein n=1 Tax=Maritimibacter sp. UBA3975 TaxID=1946833 RepID=UPI000C09DEB2|nr:DUF6173 family protein [Maritimibacter sp. UBA3975]MAM63604.1 hypothetical protein [Maritimibacter sp.]|tara:strand:- start:14558 stop:15028 length:471 start_codon:yes stop_codon:yes gene_type:complete